MAIRFPRVHTVKHIFSQSILAAKSAVSNVAEVPKGFLAVYVGESQKKRYLVPVSFVNKPQFQELLRNAEAEFGFHHPMGGLTIHCREDTFLHVASSLRS